MLITPQEKDKMCRNNDGQAFKAHSIIYHLTIRQLFLTTEEVK